MSLESFGRWFADGSSFLLGALVLLVAFKLWASSRPPQPSPGLDADPDADPDAAEGGNKIGQVFGMVALGTVFAAAAAAAVLGVIAVLAAISRGAADVLAVIFIVVAVFAMRNRRR
jgi:hypothetical protein